MHLHHHGCDGHDHGPADYNRAFAIGVVLNAIYIVFEAGYGFRIGSLALLADAGHNLSDVLGLLMAWGAHWLGRLQPTPTRTYGWRSSSILAALANSILLLVAMGGILWEAVGRFVEPQAVPGVTVMWVAALGAVINTCTALLFLRGREHDINIRAAFLHMSADAGVSVAVVLGGLGMLQLQWFWLDPLLSVAIAIVILLSTWGVLLESLHLAMHAVPKNVDLSEVEAFLTAHPAVDEVHDLHVWAMSTTETALTAHLLAPELPPDDSDRFLRETAGELDRQFGISHVTIQIERTPDMIQCRQQPSGTL